MRHQAFDDDDDDDDSFHPTSGGGVGGAPGTKAVAPGGTGGAVKGGGAVGQQRAGSPPWMPPGRPTSQGGAGAGGAPRRALTSTRGGRNVEHVHVFLDDPDKPATHPTNFYWCYASYEYKMQTTPDAARQAVYKMIEKLMERIIRGADGGGKDDVTATADDDGRSSPMLHAPPIGMGKSGASKQQGGVEGGVAQERPKVKGHVIFDIISTKKHITPDFQAGHPYLLGQDIYRFIDKHYFPWIITTFVGLTDNTARRVGRDVYYNKSDELSKTRQSFDAIDNDHLFVVYPPALSSPATAAGTNAKGVGAGLKSPRNATATANQNRASPQRGATRGSSPGRRAPSGRR